MSFLLWRALRNKLPTNEKLGTFGVEPVRCFCCYQQGWDEVDHIFIQGHFAVYIWKYFSNILGIAVQQTSLSSYLLNWGDSQGKNEAHKTIIQTLPIVICWNLWKNRCSAKYGGKWPIKWSEVVDMLEQGKHEIGGGGILRDSNGDIIYAFAIPLGEGTNNQAEVQAASYGLNWCIQHGFLILLGGFTERLIVQQICCLNKVISKISSNIIALLTNYQKQQEEVIFWRKWESKVSEGKN
ncbi:hypothetical protein KY285_007892 [Solanum tuberosum]|nr:hypothetical protein KY285_007892 [Solanum tuberosum]